MNNLEIIQTMASCDSLSVTDLYEVTVDFNGLDMSEIELIERHGAFPLFKQDNFLFIGLTDVKNRTLLSRELNQPIKTVIVNEEEINNIFFINQYDNARIALLLEGNTAAISLVKNKLLTSVDDRAIHCYFQKIPFHPFFKKWTFWRVGIEGCLPPHEIHLATFEQMAVLREYDNLESGLRPLVAHEPIHITSVEKAIDYIFFFFDFCATSVDTISPEDIEYFYPLEEAVARWNKVIQRITELEVKQDADGYTISLWLVKQTNLYQGVFKIDEQGAISSTLTLIEPNIALSTVDDILL